MPRGNRISRNSLCSLSGYPLPRSYLARSKDLYGVKLKEKVSWPSPISNLGDFKILSVKD